MERWRCRTALVTGASSGIGYATAETLAKLGLNVVGCARHTEKIKDLSKALPKGSGTLTAISCDISKEEDIKRMFSEIAKSGSCVDILINNAGISYPDQSVIDGTTDKWRSLLDVNVLGLSICAREALQSMVKNKVYDGHIINVNSTSGHSIPPFAGVHFYSATKHMVTALTEALYREVKAIDNSKIRVTSISPGSVETEGLAKLFKHMADQSKNSKTSDIETFPAIQFMKSQDVADAIVFVLSTPAHVCVKEMIIVPTEEPPY